MGFKLHIFSFIEAVFISLPCTSRGANHLSVLYPGFLENGPEPGTQTSLVCAETIKYVTIEIMIGIQKWTFESFLTIWRYLAFVERVGRKLRKGKKKKKPTGFTSFAET